MAGNTKISLVTGSTRGIGLAIARELARKGIRVIIHGKDKKTVVETANNFFSESPGVRGYAANLAKKEEVARMFREISSEYGSLDILVNNAGVSGEQVNIFNYEEAENIVGVNLLGAIACTYQALPLMNEGGRIINIASVEAFCGCFAEPVYCASKAGLIGFTFSLAKKLSEKKITVNAVSPGPTDTKRVRTLFIKDPKAADALKKNGFLADQESVVNKVVFLISSGADGITGQNIIVSNKLHEQISMEKYASS